MDRRNFLKGAGLSVGLALTTSNRMSLDAAMRGENSTPTAQGAPGARTFHVLGVPLRSGSLYPGDENDARAYRDAKLVPRLQSAGCRVVDDGDVPIPSYIPHHSIPPIRSWPGPRIAWDFVSERVSPILSQPGQIPLLVGCDCSVVVGTAQALLHDSAEEIHVLYVDGDFDDAAPDAARCQSAASLAVWLLTNRSPFWPGPALDPQRVTIIGWSNPSASKQSAVRSVSREDVQGAGAEESARRILAAIPPAVRILLHIDIDVFQKQDLPAAYFPHAQGLSLAEGSKLIGTLLKDSRIRIIEISEYDSLGDPDQRSLDLIIDMLCAGLKT
jgi:arginase